MDINRNLLNHRENLQEEPQGKADMKPSKDQQQPMKIFKMNKITSVSNPRNK